ncbi:heme exporter protein CcmB [Candidatus Zixiibacteriota bacterium]
MNASLSDKQSWLWGVLALLKKDLTCELRSAAASTAVGMFAVVTLAVVSYGVGQSPLEPVVQSGLLWTVLFFASSVGLSRTFVKEEETRTATALRLSATPSVVFGGKLLFNCVLMLALSVIVVPLFIVFFSVDPVSPGLFILYILLGILGLSGASTIVAAIISRARVKGPLFGALAFPILMPLLLLAVPGTAMALEGAAWEQASSYLTGLLGFTGAMITVSFFLFDPVWEG